MSSPTTKVDHVIPTASQISKTIRAFSGRIDVADQDPAGIAAIIYEMGMRLGRGKPIGNVNAFCALLESETPRRQWNKSRRSECRTLIRRYWAIRDAQKLLQQANKSAGYWSILSVFRIASKQKLLLQDAVREYQDFDSRPMPLNQFLMEVQGLAGRAGLSLVDNYQQENDIVLTLRRVSKPHRRSRD